MGYYSGGGLTWAVLRDANIKRLPEYKKCVDWTPSQWLQAMVGELGEYAGERKKFELGIITYEEFKKKAAKELADTVTYLSILAAHLGINMDDAIASKFNEVSRRINSRVYIGADWDWHLKPENSDE